MSITDTNVCGIPNELSDTEALPPTQLQDQMTRLGVGFDGRSYRFREFRYDRLQDALDYAQRDLTRRGAGAVAPAVVAYALPAKPTAEQSLSMQQLGIVAEKGRYRYREFLYDRVGDAIGYAHTYSRKS